MEKIPAAEEFLYRKLMLSNQPYLKGSQYVQAMIEFAKLHVIAELKKHIEHPTKPGYKRHDILQRSKELVYYLD